MTDKEVEKTKKALKANIHDHLIRTGYDLAQIDKQNHLGNAAKAKEQLDKLE